MSDVKVLHLDHPKVYARWAVVIGGGISPTKWAKKPSTIRKSTAKLSHIATSPRLARTRALARGERQSGFKRAAFVISATVFPQPEDCGMLLPADYNYFFAGQKTARTSTRLDFARSSAALLILVG